MGQLFDLSKYDTVKGSEKGARCNLLDPITKEEIRIQNEDGSTEPLWIELLGPDSEKYKKENNKITNSRIKVRNKNGTLTSEVLDQENKKLVASVITGWSPKFAIDGAPFPYSPDNARKLIDAYPWTYEQLNDFLGDRGNFCKS